MNEEQVRKIVDEIVEGWNEKEHPRDKDGKFASDDGPDSGEADLPSGWKKEGSGWYGKRVSSSEFEKIKGKVEFYGKDTGKRLRGKFKGESEFDVDMYVPTRKISVSKAQRAKALEGFLKK